MMMMMPRQMTKMISTTTAAAKRMMSTQFNKSQLVQRLLVAKAESGRTYDEIAAHLGVTNAYAAQLFHHQAQLKPATAEKLRNVVPALNDDDIRAMSSFPTRSYDPQIAQEPNTYRMVEAVLHYADGIKAIVNEKFGDGIMSAIDFYVNVDKVKGKHNEDRVVITFNGKYLQHIEQIADDDTSTSRAK